MKIDFTTKDLWKMQIVSWMVIVILVISIAFLYGKYGVLKMENTVSIHDQNFGIIKQAIDSFEGRFQRLELANQIQGNIVESGKLDDKGNPAKK